MTSWMPGLTVDPVSATRTGCASSPILRRCSSSVLREGMLDVGFGEFTERR